MKECPKIKEALKIIDYRINLVHSYGPEALYDAEFEMNNLKRIREALKPSECKVWVQKRTDKEELIKRGVIKF